MDPKATPIPVKRALRNFGQALRDARRRRRIPMWLAAARAGISRATLAKIEKGEEGVSLGAYAMVLFILGQIHRLAEISSLDAAESAFESRNLPKRIRIPKSRA